MTDEKDISFIIIRQRITIKFCVKLDKSDQTVFEMIQVAFIEEIFGQNGCI